MSSLTYLLYHTICYVCFSQLCNNW